MTKEPEANANNAYPIMYSYNHTIHNRLKALVLRSNIAYQVRRKLLEEWGWRRGNGSLHVSIRGNVILGLIVLSVRGIAHHRGQGMIMGMSVRWRMGVTCGGEMSIDRTGLKKRESSQMLL